MDTPIVVAVAVAAAVGGALLGMLARGHVGLAVDEGRARRGATHRGRGASPPEGAHPRGEGREAAPPGRGRGRGARQAHRARPASSAACSPATSSSTSAADMLEERDRKLLERERELDKTREDLARAHAGAGRGPRARVEHVGDDAKSVLLEAVREEAEHDAVKLARAIERAARDEAQDKARDIIVTAMQRVVADHTAEHTVSVVHLPSDEMKGRIIGREGRNIRALEQATGVDLIIDDTPETVVLSRLRPGPPRGRPPGRDQAHRRRPHPSRPHRGGRRQGPRRGRPRHAPGRRAGRLRGRRPGPAAGDHQAPRPAQVPHELRPERADARRRDRHLAAVIAAEIGADVQIAKMGGLLHDIGKAVDHEVEGPHAAIGAQIAAAPQPAVQGHQRHRRPPPGSRVRLPRGADRPGRRRHQRVAAGRPRRVDGHLRQAARGPPGHRRELQRRRALVRGPGRARGADPRPAGGDRRPDRLATRARHRAARSRSS